MMGRVKHWLFTPPAMPSLGLGPMRLRGMGGRKDVAADNAAAATSERPSGSLASWVAGAHEDAAGTAAGSRMAVAARASAAVSAAVSAASAVDGAGVDATAALALAAALRDYPVALPHSLTEALVPRLLHYKARRRMHALTAAAGAALASLTAAATAAIRDTQTRTSAAAPVATASATSDAAATGARVAERISRSSETASTALGLALSSFSSGDELSDSEDEDGSRDAAALEPAAANAAPAVAPPASAYDDFTGSEASPELDASRSIGKFAAVASAAAPRPALAMSPPLPPATMAAVAATGGASARSPLLRSRRASRFFVLSAAEVQQAHAKLLGPLWAAYVTLAAQANEAGGTHGGGLGPGAELASSAVVEGPVASVGALLHHAGAALLQKLHPHASDTDAQASAPDATVTAGDAALIQAFTGAGVATHRFNRRVRAVASALFALETGELQGAAAEAIEEAATGSPRVSHASAVLREALVLQYGGEAAFAAAAEGGTSAVAALHALAAPLRSGAVFDSSGSPLPRGSPQEQAALRQGLALLGREHRSTPADGCGVALPAQVVGAAVPPIPTVSSHPLEREAAAASDDTAASLPPPPPPLGDPRALCFALRAALASDDPLALAAALAHERRHVQAALAALWRAHVKSVSAAAYAAATDAEARIPHAHHARAHRVAQQLSSSSASSSHLPRAPQAARPAAPRALLSSMERLQARYRAAAAAAIAAGMRVAVLDAGGLILPLQAAPVPASLAALTSGTGPTHGLFQGCGRGASASLRPFRCAPGNAAGSGSTAAAAAAEPVGPRPAGLCSVPVDEVSSRMFRGDALSVDVLLYAPAPRRLPDRGSAGARAARKLVQLDPGASDTPAAIEEEEAAVASPAVSMLGNTSVTAGPGGPAMTVAALAGGGSTGPTPLALTATSSGVPCLPADDAPPSPDAPSPAGTIDPDRIRHEAEAQTPLAEAVAASAAALAAAGARDSARADFGTACIRHETEAQTPLAEAAAASAASEGGPQQLPQPQPQSQSTNRLRRSVQRVSAPASALAPLSAATRASLEAQQQAAGHPEWRAFVDSLGAPPPTPASAHVVVFFNGLGGSAYDTRLLRSHLKTAHPHLLCYSTTASQVSTEGRGTGRRRSLDCGARASLPVPRRCRAARQRATSSRQRCASHARSRGSSPSRWGRGSYEGPRRMLLHLLPPPHRPTQVAEDGLIPWRVSFVTFSLGGVVARLALRHPILSRFAPLLHAFVSIAAPHLGLLYPASSVFAAGVCVVRWGREGGVAPPHSPASLPLQLRLPALPRQCSTRAVAAGRRAARGPLGAAAARTVARCCGGVCSPGRCSSRGGGGATAWAAPC